jgi:hypothetical protein
VSNKVVTNCSERYSFDGITDLRNYSVEYLLTGNYPSDPSVDKLFNYSLFIYNTTVLLDRLCIPSGE